jgi:hypothetical protein
MNVIIRFLRIHCHCKNTYRTFVESGVEVYIFYLKIQIYMSCLWFFKEFFSIMSIQN